MNPARGGWPSLPLAALPLLQGADNLLLALEQTALKKSGLLCFAIEHQIKGLFKDAQGLGMNKANSIQISQASASNASFSHLPIKVFLYFTTSFLFHMLFNVKKKKNCHLAAFWLPWKGGRNKPGLAKTKNRAAGFWWLQCAGLKDIHYCCRKAVALVEFPMTFILQVL